MCNLRGEPSMALLLFVEPWIQLVSKQQLNLVWNSFPNVVFKLRCLHSKLCNGHSIYCVSAIPGFYTTHILSQFVAVKGRICGLIRLVLEQQLPSLSLLAAILRLRGAGLWRHCCDFCLLLLHLQTQTGVSLRGTQAYKCCTGVCVGMEHR